MTEILGPLPITEEDLKNFQENPGTVFVDYKGLPEPGASPERPSFPSGDYDTIKK